MLEGRGSDGTVLICDLNNIFKENSKTDRKLSHSFLHHTLQWCATLKTMKVRSRILYCYVIFFLFVDFAIKKSRIIKHLSLSVSKE